MARQTQNNVAQRKKVKSRSNDKFFIPKTKQQFRICLQRMTLQFFNIFFNLADKAMYLLGPILITLASVLIVGLTYVYFRVILPMLAGTNWVVTDDDWNAYQKGESNLGSGGQEDGEFEEAGSSDHISRLSSTLLALSTPTGILHTSIIVFLLVNIIYNYYKCVITSNSGPRYGVVVRELADVTGFRYPNTEEELVRCKKAFERKIYEKAKKKRDELMAAANANANASNVARSSVATTPANTTNNGDVESQTSPLMATSTTTNTPVATATGSSIAKKAPLVLPRIHNWQLLSPIEWGYCRYSSQPKPPRSHYDHVTKALVLNMDHYCPWMFNCIGYFNYRYFFNFLWFVAIALVYGTAICFRAFMKLNSKEYRDQVRSSGGYQRPLKEIVVRHFQSDPYIPTPDERTPVALGFMLCLCLGAAVMCLGGFHLYLVLTAQSTIEFHGNFSKRRKGGWKNPYSAGSWRGNWEMVYGTRYWPYQSAVGNSNNERKSGFCSTLMAMMPSNREPEFLPLPVDGKLVRRRCKEVVSEESDEDSDLEMGSEMSSSSSETESPSTIEETEFLMEPKENDGHLVGRARTKNRA